MLSPNLRQLCLVGGAQVIATDAAGSISADALAQRIQKLAAGLARRPESRWGIWFEHSVDFLCGFMALAVAGKALVMPHNLQAGSALQMAPHFDALLTDNPEYSLPLPQLTEAELALPGADFLPDTHTSVNLTLFTSGTTGNPEPIVKTLDLLEAELAILARVFGDRVSNYPILSTVSHQHIYGLLHKLLWPLWRGAPIITDSCQYPEELAALAARFGPLVLVSSPTHLSRLPESPAFCQQAHQLAAIFSSGGLLQAAAATALKQVCAASVIEVLGSTETGGVGWRDQAIDAHWQPLPEVNVSVDADSGCLAVLSPHLGSDRAFVMGDKVSFTDAGRFVLAGRADTVVKVEGKRLSLTEMQQRLAEHPWVTDARLAVVQGKRDEVGAVVVLTAPGRAQLGAGKRALNEALRTHLSAFFERPLLPRRWRYVDLFPHNAQGKVLAADITALLRSPAVELHAPTTDVTLQLPAQIDVIEQSDNAIILRFAVAPTMPCFAGHFEQLPVLAGVVQITWAMALAERFLQVRGAFVGMQSVKFQKLVRPPVELTLSLSYQAEKNQLKFTYEHPHYGRCTAGIMQFGASL
ncbi:MAG TPA: AMP-binding protein [Cellvibrionaceae bacterium]